MLRRGILFWNINVEIYFSMHMLLCIEQTMFFWKIMFQKTFSETCFSKDTEQYDKFTSAGYQISARVELTMALF